MSAPLLKAKERGVPGSCEMLSGSDLALRVVRGGLLKPGDTEVCVCVCECEYCENIQYQHQYIQLYRVDLGQ